MFYRSRNRICFTEKHYNTGGFTEKKVMTDLQEAFVIINNYNRRKF